MEKLLPAFETNSIAVAFASDDNFVPYMATAIRSILANGKPEDNYDFVVLHSGISRENQDLLREMADAAPNASIRTVDVSEQVANYPFYTAAGAESLSRETYYRLLLPELMENYGKVLYLDGDMIALTDIAPLYHTDLEESLLGAARDLGGLMRYFGAMNERKRYWETELKLDAPENYFNAGMLLLNIPALRAEFTTGYLLDFATSREWKQHDQDVLNVLCQGRVKLLDGAWNSIQPEPVRALPQPLQAEFQTSVAQPRIAHFAGSPDKKPWIALDAPHSAAFWQYAAQTPYLLEIVRRRLALDRPAVSTRAAMEAEFRQGKVGAWYIVRFARAWLAHKLGR